jgi:hypothetical protein
MDAAAGLRRRPKETRRGRILTKDIGGSGMRRCRNRHYLGEPTQTATNGVFEADPVGPHEAPRSPRNCA